MRWLGVKRLDLMPYPGPRFNKPYISQFVCSVDILEDVRLEDNAFVFDNQAQQLPNMALSPGTTLLQLAGRARLYRAFQDFLETIHRYTFVSLGMHVRRLHWKIATPFVNKYRPRTFDSEMWTEEVEVLVAAAIKEDMQREDEVEELEMKIQGHDGPLAGWSRGNDDDHADEIEAEPAEATTGAAGGQRPLIITPSLSFARIWKHLAHLETTTSVLYGLPAALFEQRCVARVPPRYLKVLVLEERWHPGCGPQDSLLALYRYRLYNDLRFMARGIGFPGLQNLVFIPDKRAGYWSGLPERLEWVRGPKGGVDSRGRFPEMKVIVEANGEEAAVDRQQGEWNAIWGGLNAAF